MVSTIQIGDAVLVRVRQPYIGRVYDVGERWLYVLTPFKSSPRRTASREVCEVVDKRLEPQKVKL